MSDQEPKETLPSKEGRDATILGKKIKRDDFEHLMGFYEADHRLSQDDRKVMSKDLTNAGVSTMLWALLDSSIVVTAPLIYRRFREKKMGAPLPTPPRAVAFFRLMFFLMAGLGVYFWSSRYHARTDREYRVSMLEADCKSGKFSETELALKQRMLDVWKALDANNLALFTVYYFKTSSDPSLAMKSPKDMVSFDPHAVMYVPPHQKDGPLLGVLGAVKEHERQAPHWDKIREDHGFVKPKEETKSSESEDVSAVTSEDVTISEDPRVVDDVAPQLENKPESKGSAWDRLRKGN